MDIETQEAIERLAEEHGADNVMVILGSPDAESAGIAAETVVEGDPSYAGPLAEAQLGLTVYHVLEDEVKEAIPEEEWEEQVALMVDVIDKDEVSEAVAEWREKA